MAGATKTIAPETIPTLTLVSHRIRQVHPGKDAQMASQFTLNKEYIYPFRSLIWNSEMTEKNRGKPMIELSFQVMV